MVQKTQIATPESQVREVRAALKEGIARLRKADTPSHTLAAELLLIHVLGCDRTWLYAHPEARLDSVSMQRYLALIARRAAGEPTQHITGKQEFWGLEFEVTPDVLIPRPETEHVIEVALERMGQPAREKNVRIADVGTGSGCLAVALASEFPRAEVLATDISAAALEVARRNAKRHALGSRIQFICCNLLDPFLDARPGESPEGEQFDLIVSNPPYIPLGDAVSLPREVRDHEPAVALFAGEKGFDVYPSLVMLAASLLRPGGLLVLEIGHNTLPILEPFLATPEWHSQSVRNDLAALPRVVSALRSGK
jgi:release factor glutamine methyltransferase